MNTNVKKTNSWLKLILPVLTGITAIAGATTAVIKDPYILCKVGLNLETCTVISQEVELVTQMETGEALGGVKVEIIGVGAPEIEYSDNNGYAKVKISNKGDVRVNLSKSGYPVQDFSINLANDRNRVRIIRFTKSGQLQVKSLPTLPTAVAMSSSSATPTPSVSPTQFSPSSDQQVQVDRSVTWQLKQCTRQQASVSCSFLLTVTEDFNGYYFYLDRNTKMTDYKGHEYYPSKGQFVDTKAGAGGYITHDLQKYSDLKKGPTYDVSIDFQDVPTSINEVNSLIISAYSGNKLKFATVSIKTAG